MPRPASGSSSNMLSMLISCLLYTSQLAEDEIFISDGAKSDLANVLGLFDLDNTVLVPDPRCV